MMMYSRRTQSNHVDAVAIVSPAILNNEATHCIGGQLDLQNGLHCTKETHFYTSPPQYSEPRVIHQYDFPRHVPCRSLCRCWGLTSCPTTYCSVERFWSGSPGWIHLPRESKTARDHCIRTPAGQRGRERSSTNSQQRNNSVATTSAPRVVHSHCNDIDGKQHTYSLG